MHGREGWVRGKLSVLWRAILVTIEVKRLRRTTQKLWRLLLGLWSHSLSFRREGYAFLQEVYAFAERFDRVTRQINRFGHTERRKGPLRGIEVRIAFEDG